MIFSAKLSRYLLIFSIILVASIVLPEFYSMLFSRSISGPKLYYSPIKKAFVKTQIVNRVLERRDEEGNLLTREEFEKLTPLFNYRQLLYRDEMPDTIDGVPIDVQEMRLNNIFLTVKPSDVYRYTIPLNPLIESAPGRPDLQMPDDFFRIADRIEFIKCYTNEVKEDLSKLFNDALVKSNFSFPAKGIFGNPSTRKPFDEGYFIIDNNDKLFHLKRVKNRPYVREIKLPDGVKIDFVKVMEMNLKEFYALFTTMDNRIFLISYDNYKLIEVPSEGYNRKNMRLVFMGNKLYRIISFVADNSVKTIVTDRKYKVVAENKETWKTNEDLLVGNVASYIFPFKLELTNNNNKYVNFNFYFSDYRFLIVNILVVLLFLIYIKTRIKKFSVSQILEIVIVLTTGLFGLLAVLLIKDES